MCDLVNSREFGPVILCKCHFVIIGREVEYEKVDPPLFLSSGFLQYWAGCSEFNPVDPQCLYVTRWLYGWHRYSTHERCCACSGIRSSELTLSTPITCHNESSTRSSLASPTVLHTSVTIAISFQY